MSNPRPNMPTNQPPNLDFYPPYLQNPPMGGPRMMPGGGPPPGMFMHHPPGEGIYPFPPQQMQGVPFDPSLQRPFQPIMPGDKDPQTGLRRPNLSLKPLTSDMSKPKRFLHRLRTEILPPRHPSATIAIPQAQESRNKQTAVLLKLFSHVEILEKKLNSANLWDKISPELEIPKPKESINSMQLLLDDDEMFESSGNQIQAQIEDDVAEQVSEEDSDEDKDKNNHFLKNDSVLIVDEEERLAMRQLKARRRKKTARIEKVEVDQDWLDKLIKRRRKTGEGEGDEVEVSADTRAEELVSKAFAIPQEEGMKHTLLLDYLTHIKVFSNSLKHKMYMLMIKLLNKTKANVAEEEMKLSNSEEDILQFILMHDRESFNDVVKHWIYYEYNEYLCNNSSKYEVLLVEILKKIISAKLYLNSNKWISFILNQPSYPKVIFNHIFDVCMESIQKEVPAIKLLQKFLMSSCFKLSIKKDCTKLLLKCIISNPKNVSVKKQAACSLLIAHAHGIFQFDKMDELRNYILFNFCIKSLLWSK